MDSVITDMAILIIGLAIGGLITHRVSKRYYEKAAKELKVETEKTRKLINISLRALENADIVELTRDAAGKITGITQYGSIKESVSLSARAVPDVAKAGVSEDKTVHPKNED